MAQYFRMIASILALFAAIQPLRADETLSAVPGAHLPEAKASDLAWLAGNWKGTGIEGGVATEVYSPPAGGQIVGHFRQLRRDGTVMFYELMTIAEVGTTVHYRLKHFDEDLSGWEEKAEVRSFPLVAVTGDAWFFDGLTIRRAGPNRMVATVRIKNARGTHEKLSFRYERVVH